MNKKIVPFGPVGPNLIRFDERRGYNAVLSDNVAKHAITCFTVGACVFGVAYLVVNRKK